MTHMATRTKLKAEEAKRRVVLDDDDDELGDEPSYFTSGSTKQNITWTKSGCCVYDEALGGGYGLGRVVNIVGDRSSGKTLLAMEACANFARDYPTGWIRYAESEAAFDPEYAEALGIPTDRIILNPGGAAMDTVEQVYDDMVLHLDKFKGQPGIYILDSLDAISDEAEMGRAFNEGSYGGTKPKQIGKLFRLLVERFHQQKVLLIVISQLRDKLNVTFGETKTRSGGRALDFYCTHIVWLAEIQKEKRTIQGIERIVGVRVEAYVKKNKLGLCFRRARYTLLFGYGIDDLSAGVEWLIENKCESRLDELGVSKSGFKVKILAMRNRGGPETAEFREKLTAIVRSEWQRIEGMFLPQAKKY